MSKEQQTSQLGGVRTRARLAGLFFLLPLVSTLGLRADDIKATVAACGRPTRENAVGDKMWTLLYMRRGVYMDYEKVEGQWHWVMAIDTKEMTEISKLDLFRRMPCTKKLVEASEARPKSSPIVETANTTTAPSSNGSGMAGMFVFAIIVGAMAMTLAGRKEKQQAMAALADVPVKCPYCGSPQVHAEKRGWKLTTGLIGSGKVLITCMRCGKRFKPGHGA